MKYTLLLLTQISLLAFLHAISQHTAANSFGRKSGNGARKPTSLTSCSTKELLSPTKNLGDKTFERLTCLDNYHNNCFNPLLSHRFSNQRFSPYNSESSLSVQLCLEHFQPTPSCLSASLREGRPSQKLANRKIEADAL